MGRIYFIIFTVSSSLLIFEVSLTRLFSIYLWYHFAFMVISIAMLGIGSAGTVLAIRNRGRYTDKEENIPVAIRGDNLLAGRSITIYSMFAGISIPVCYFLLNYIPFDPAEFAWDKKQLIYLFFYCIVLSVPFFFAGLVIATAFSYHSRNATAIYSSDLLGAGTGSLAVIAMLNMAGPEYAILTASSICLIGVVRSGNRIAATVSLLCLGINLFLLIAHPSFIKIKTSPYKRLSLFLNYPGAEHHDTYHSSYAKIDTFKSPAVRFAPGLSLSYFDPLPEQTGLAIDGQTINVVTDGRDRKKLRFLEFLPSSVSYETGKKKKVLIIDPSGGMQVLTADYYGAELIHKVESNPLLVKVIRDDYREFSGGIYDRDIWTGYGRNWLHSRVSPDKADPGYDLIDLPLTSVAVSSVFGISEDYRYTVDAFKEYLDALGKEGMITVSLYLLPPPRMEFRILSTLIAAFEERGVKDLPERIAAIRSWDSMTILAKNSPFTGREIKAIREFAGSRQFDLVYLPGIREEESNLHIKTPENEQFKGFYQLLINPQSRELFIDNYLFDIKPVRDNKPFFHYYLKLGNIRKIYKMIGQKWLFLVEEGYLLPFVFAISLLLSILIIFLPVLVIKIRNRSRGKSVEYLKRKEKSGQSALLPVLLYFSMLGLGFMFIEVSLIQESILIFENPSYAFAIVLSAILIGSGLGSMASSGFSLSKNSRSLPALVFLIALYAGTFPLTFNTLSSMTLFFRIVSTLALLLPLGFLMGIPFPMGMKLLGEKDQALIPWAWAINACLSVIAPILTIMLALVIGFNTVLWIASLSYLIAFVSIRKLARS